MMKIMAVCPILRETEDGPIDGKSHIVKNGNKTLCGMDYSGNNWSSEFGPYEIISDVPDCCNRCKRIANKTA